MPSRKPTALASQCDAAANYKPRKSKEAFLAASANVGRMKAAVASGQSVFSAFTPEEREAMEDDNEREIIVRVARDPS